MAHVLCNGNRSESYRHSVYFTDDKASIGNLKMGIAPLNCGIVDLLLSIRGHYGRAFRDPVLWQASAARYLIHINLVDET